MNDLESLNQSLIQNIKEKEKLMENWVEQLSKKDKRMLELENDLEILKALSKESEDI